MSSASAMPTVLSKYADEFAEVGRILRESRPGSIISQGINLGGGIEHCNIVETKCRPFRFHPVKIVVMCVQPATRPYMMEVMEAWGPTLTEEECLSIERAISVPVRFVREPSSIQRP